MWKYYPFVLFSLGELLLIIYLVADVYSSSSTIYFFRTKIENFCFSETFEVYYCLISYQSLLWCPYASFFISLNWFRWEKTRGLFLKISIKTCYYLPHSITPYLRENYGNISMIYLSWVISTPNYFIVLKRPKYILTFMIYLYTSQRSRLNHNSYGHTYVFVSWYCHKIMKK